MKKEYIKHIVPATEGTETIICRYNKPAKRIITIHDDNVNTDDLGNKVLNLLNKFPNGFESWMETHHEVVTAITEAMTAEELEPEFQNVATRRREEQGIGGVYELAEELTDKFEQLNKGREWDGEFFDEVTEFLRTELNEEEE